MPLQIRDVSLELAISDGISLRLHLRGPVCSSHVLLENEGCRYTVLPESCSTYQVFAPDVGCATRVRWVTKPDLQVPQVLTREN